MTIGGETQQSKTTMMKWDNGCDNNKSDGYSINEDVFMNTIRTGEEGGLGTIVASYCCQSAGNVGPKWAQAYNRANKVLFMTLPWDNRAVGSEIKRILLRRE